MVESGLMRVVVAEDSVLLREGLLRLLDEAGHTVGAAGRGGPPPVGVGAGNPPGAGLP